MTAAPGLRRGTVPLWQRVWRRFWVLPALIMTASVALAIILPRLELDALIQVPALFAGGPDGARAVLSAIAGAMISVTVLVFSVTIVVLQLASTQFTPRIIGSFLDSRTAQVTLGVFIGSFLYSLTVLRWVRGGDDNVSGSFVPEAAVTLSYLYVLASVAMFLAFIQHITSRVQVSRIISDLGDDTVEALGEGPDQDDEAADRAHDHVARRSDDEGLGLHLDERHGHVVTIAAGALTSLAAEHDVVVLLHVGLGDFLVPGQVIGTVHADGGGAPRLDDDVLTELARCLHLNRERDLDHDPLFGTRQLVDIGDRALSSGINDPTTAAQAVNECHRVLRVLSCRPDPSPLIRDDDGEVRATHSPQTFRRHLDMVVDELWFYAQGNAQVQESLSTLLDELRLHARSEHLPAIDAARERCTSSTGGS